LVEIDETEFSLISSITNLDGHESRLLAIATIGELTEQVRDLKLKLREREGINKMTFFAGAKEQESSSDAAIKNRK
jgi:hypothetical protein